MNNHFLWYTFTCDYIEKTKNGDGQEIFFALMLFLILLLYFIGFIEEVIGTSKKILISLKRRWRKK